ncbi:MAG TPA: hypothetical protein VFL04_04765 [Rectinemataceae bacterium]|nr:hypothetical protein [Rectinemataceae bacterium]
MTRGLKAVLFVLGATVANIILTGGFFIGLLALYGLTLGRLIKVPTAMPVILGAFVLAVVLASVTYGAVLKRLRKRYDLEKRLGLK